MPARMVKKKVARGGIRPPRKPWHVPTEIKRKLPAPWDSARKPPPFELLVQARTIEERQKLCGKWKITPDAPRCFADDYLFLREGSLVPSTYGPQSEARPTSELVGFLALAEAPIDIIVRVLQRKRRELGYEADHIGASFLTEEMVRHEFAYEIDTFPYEIQATVAKSTMEQARGGNAKALELMILNKLPWTTQTGAPPSSKSPWQVTGELRLLRDQAIEAAHAEAGEDA